MKKHSKMLLRPKFEAITTLFQWHIANVGLGMKTNQNLSISNF